LAVLQDSEYLIFETLNIFKRLATMLDDAEIKEYQKQKEEVCISSFAKYSIKVEHLSTHSLRKTFGRKVVESAGENSEMALIKLSELFNHSSP
jgi:hypothetical protein